MRLFGGRAVETVGLDDVGWPGLGEGSCPELPKGRYQERKEEQDVNLRIFRRVPRAQTRAVGRARGGGGREHLAGRRRGRRTAASAAPARADQVPGEATRLGQLSGILPASHLTLPSAIEVNLSQEYVRLPLYPGIAYAGTLHQEKVWYILEDASTPGAADDLGVNFAPKLANIGISCPACVQTVHLVNLPPSQNHFGPAPISFAGAPDFSPTRIAVPGPDGFPLAKLALTQSR